ncbi:hypothetical protein FRC01_007850 [Tulasnella sp. 417]|nr:hypothetical protein FRC01_007850 [Tulasnella sp. 417]
MSTTAHGNKINSQGRLNISDFNFMNRSWAIGRVPGASEDLDFNWEVLALALASCPTMRWRSPTQNHCPIYILPPVLITRKEVLPILPTMPARFSFSPVPAPEPPVVNGKEGQSQS